MNSVTAHRFYLDKSSKKLKCPSCGQKCFVGYIDSTTGSYMADVVGRCDRENNCGYHFTPKQFYLENPNAKTDNSEQNSERTVNGRFCQYNQETKYLPFELMDKSVSKHTGCNLYIFLAKLFTEPIASKLCEDFFIGKNKDGNTCFWQVDIAGRVRQVKIIQYNTDTGKRNKEAGVQFAGKKILGDNVANLQQCFFGEYQLSLEENKSKSVAITESEKTAAIASVYFQNFIWLATGGTNGAKWTNSDVCKVLAGRKIILFPDLGAFDQWSKKGLLLSAVAGCKVAVSDLLEKNATEEEKKQGLDIADYLLQVQDSTGLALTDYEYPVMWDYKRR